VDSVDMSGDTALAIARRLLSPPELLAVQHALGGGGGGGGGGEEEKEEEEEKKEEEKKKERGSYFEKEAKAVEKEERWGGKGSGGEGAERGPCRGGEGGVILKEKA
jgi:hypothetical protein